MCVYMLLFSTECKSLISWRRKSMLPCVCLKTADEWRQMDKKTTEWWNGWRDKQTGEATDRRCGVTLLPGCEVWMCLQEYAFHSAGMIVSVHAPWTEHRARMSTFEAIVQTCALAHARIGAHALGCTRRCTLSSISMTNVFWWDRKA